MTVDRNVTLLSVNFLLPEGDYRVAYATRPSAQATVVAAPSQPLGVPANRFVQVRIGEGLGKGDAMGALQLVALLVRLRRYLRVAFFYSTKLVFIGPPVCRLLGTPSVATVTGLGRVYDSDTVTSRLLRPVHRVCFALAARCATRIAFQNTAHADAFAERFPRLAHKRVVIRSALALESAPLDPRQPDGRLRVVCVARLLPSKGIDDFLAVAERLVEEPMDFVLIGGRSPGHDALYERVLSAYERGVIIYRGRLSSEEVHEEYARSHALFLPSHGEALARVFLEAAHFGLLPVGYDIDGNRDVLAEGARVVPVGGVSEAVQVLKEALAGPIDAVQRARRFQEHVLREYSVGRYLETMDRLVREVQK